MGPNAIRKREEYVTAIPKGVAAPLPVKFDALSPSRFRRVTFSSTSEAISTFQKRRIRFCGWLGKWSLLNFPGYFQMTLTTDPEKGRVC